MQLDFPEAGVQARIMPRGSDQHRAAERAHLEEGGSLALPHRAAWRETQPAARSLAVHVVETDSSRSLALFCADRIPSRWLRGFDILRVERFGEFADEQAAIGASLALSELAAGSTRVARTRVEVFSRTPGELNLLERVLGQQGFGRSTEPRCYEKTGLLDIRPTVDQLFSGLHGTARRHIRAVSKNPVEIREVVDRRLAGRMSVLMRETFARTGSEPATRDWESVIRFSRDNPTLSRVAGLFRADGGPEDPAGMLAFVWGARHGATVEYVAGASARAPDLKMPLSYGLMWNLIEWAHEGGSHWFDFGGISRGSHGSDDPVGGISDFKRYFRPEVHTVGAEFTRSDSAVLGTLARLAEGLRRLSAVARGRSGS